MNALQETACTNGMGFAPNYGGVIATVADASVAIGVYAVNKSQGGSVDTLSIAGTWPCPRPPQDTGEFNFDTMILDSISIGPFPAGETKTNVYIVSGTLQGVVQKMSALYQQRDSIPR